MTPSLCCTPVVQSLGLGNYMIHDIDYRPWFRAQDPENTSRLSRQQRFPSRVSAAYFARLGQLSCALACLFGMARSEVGKCIKKIGHVAGHAIVTNNKYKSENGWQPTSQSGLIRWNSRLTKMSIQQKKGGLYAFRVRPVMWWYLLAIRVCQTLIRLFGL